MEVRLFFFFAKTQGIVCAQVLNSLILKINDIAIFVAKNITIFPSEPNVSAKSVLHMKLPQITEIGTGKLCSRTVKNGIYKQYLSGEPERK